MERHFNTLKNECTNSYEFATEEALYYKVEKFVYVYYNHVRPNSFKVDTCQNQIKVSPSCLIATVDNHTPLRINLIEFTYYSFHP